MLDVTKRRTLLEQLQLHEQLRRYAYVPDGVKEARAKGIDPGAFIAGNGRKNNAFGEPNGQERITEAGLADARRALTVPREVTKKLDSLTEREFNWGEATKAVEHLQLPARVSALSALKGRTYVPPGVSEAQAKGLDPSGFRCGKGHERVMLGKDRIESARDLDAATEGIRTMGVKSADATLAILSFGFGPAMQAGLAMKGARAATRAGGAAGPAGTAVHSIRGGYNAFTLRSGLDVALPAIEQGAEVLSVLDPDHAHIYGGIGAVSGLASSFRSLSKAGTMKGGAAVAQTISGAAGMVDAGLSAGEAVVGKPQDEAQRLRLLQLHSALKGVKEVSGSAAKGLTDPLAP
jgi:ethanolamine utilization microcompartment shell protein EutL